MESIAMYSKAEEALTLDQIDGALDLIRSRKAVLIESSGGPEGWRAGYAVPVARTWYWFPKGWATYRRLPAFIRSEEDALEFIQAAESWYASGVNAGVEYAQDHLRRWVNDRMRKEM